MQYQEHQGSASQIKRCVTTGQTSMIPTSTSFRTSSVPEQLQHLSAQCHGMQMQFQFVKVKVSERKAVAPVTIAHTRERQEVAFAAAYMHGNKFVLTGGEHMTSDDMFKEDQ